MLFQSEFRVVRMTIWYAIVSLCLAGIVYVTIIAHIEVCEHISKTIQGAAARIMYRGVHTSLPWAAQALMNL